MSADLTPTPWAPGPSEPLTEETFRKSLDAFAALPPHPCSEGRHILHPNAQRGVPGHYPCASMCGAVIEVR